MTNKSDNTKDKNIFMKQLLEKAQHIICLIKDFLSDTAKVIIIILPLIATLAITAAYDINAFQFLILVVLCALTYVIEIYVSNRP